MRPWYVYMIRCSDGSLYTGVTTDIERRFREHKAGKIGAKYTRAKLPLHIAYDERCGSRSEAQSREFVLKKLKKDEKEALVRSSMKTRAKGKKRA